MKIRHYNTGNSSEQYSLLPVYTTSDQSKGRVVYSVYVDELKAGDILQVMGEAEFTNDLSYLVSVVSGIQICDSQYQVVGGIEVCEFNGPNVERAITHHSVHVKVGTYEVPYDMEGKYVNWISYAASTAAVSGHNIQVGTDYGRLSVLIFTEQELLHV